MTTIKISNQHELSYDVLGSPSYAKVAFFLHGIMGSKKNLHSFAKKLAAANEQWTMVLFDLRNHGQSSKHWMPFDLASTAKDIVYAAKALDIAPTAIVGHSFGAKVSAMVALELSSIKSLWMLDCSPHSSVTQPLENTAKTTALQLMDILEKISWPLSSRKVLVEELNAHGLSSLIALWMTTNLVQVEDGYKLIFYPHEMRLMLNSFLATDVWPHIASIAKRTDIHLVAAENSGRLGKEEQSKLLSLAKERGYFHVLKNAGHFLHVDNPQDLIDLMSPFFAQ